MRTKLLVLSGFAAAGVFTGCNTIPPGAERGPNGTMAYQVQVESSEPGVQIEVNGEVVGNTPLTLKIFGDPDGTFHDFGSYFYTVRALPASTNQFVQVANFRTGHLFTPEDRIPSRINFDMHQPPPAYTPAPGVYGAPPPAYYYGPPVYVGPRIYFGPPVYYHRHW
jgi:hypothetical protein